MKLGRLVLIVCTILAFPAAGALLFLHYDPALARRLGSLRIGAVSVAAALSAVGVANGAWSTVQVPIGYLRKKYGTPYTAVSEENDRLLDKAAKDLGVILRKGADQEIGIRGLIYPPPMPVRWHQVEATGPGGATLQRIGLVRVDPLTNIARSLRALRRFVLIGEPGSGKSAVTLFLQRDLIDADPAGAVPYLVSLSTWDTETDLLDWAAARLEERNPSFAKPLSEGGSESVAMRLLSDGRVSLILDGMDELSDDRLIRVFTKINERGVNFPVVITCRTEDYERATQTAGAAGGSVKLANAPLFQLLAPRLKVVEDYLTESQAPGRWDNVLAALRSKDSPVAQALRTPLMVWLARRVHEHVHPDEFAAKLKLRDYDNHEAIENHLLDRFIPEVYRDDKAAARKARYFTFIAEHVYARNGTEYKLPVGDKLESMVDDGQDIAWWRLIADRRAKPTDALLLTVVGALVPGGCVGLCWATSTWNWLRHPAPLVSGLVLGVVVTAGMAFSCLTNNPPPTGTQFSKPGNFGVATLVMATAAFVGSAASLAMSGHLTNALYSLIVAMPVAMAYTFTNPYVDAKRVETPLRHYRADIQQTVVYTVAYGLGVGIIVSIYRPWPLSLTLGVTAGITGGFTYGAVYKIAYGKKMPSGMVAWIRFRVAHLRFALAKELPLGYFRFLDEAHRLGVLRQTGGNYQFSHRRLRDRLLEPAEARKQVTR